MMQLYIKEYNFRIPIIYYTPVIPTGRWKLKINVDNEALLYLEVKYFTFFKKWIKESKLEVKHTEREYINKCF